MKSARSQAMKRRLEEDEGAERRREWVKRAGQRVAGAFLLAALLPASASSGTKLVRSWRDPSAGPLQFKKVLVLCIAPHESQELFGEAELVRLMKRTQGVAAHSIMTPEAVKDEKQMRAVVAREGFDGAVTLRYVAENQRLTEHVGAYIPATVGFWSSYTTAWLAVYDPGYVRMDRRIQMETQVYSVKDDKLVWSGLSESMNPDSAKEIVNEVVKAVAADLKKHKLID